MSQEKTTRASRAGSALEDGSNAPKRLTPDLRTCRAFLRAQCKESRSVVSGFKKDLGEARVPSRVVHVLQWSEVAIRRAVRWEAAAFLLDALSDKNGEATPESARRWLEREVTLKAARPSKSTSALRDLIEDARLGALAELLEFFSGEDFAHLQPMSERRREGERQRRDEEEDEA